MARLSLTSFLYSAPKTSKPVNNFFYSWQKRQPPFTTDFTTLVHLKYVLEPETLVCVCLTHKWVATLHLVCKFKVWRFGFHFVARASDRGDLQLQWRHSCYPELSYCVILKKVCTLAVNTYWYVLQYWSTMLAIGNDHMQMEAVFWQL